jgi:5,5'-dehydrodivanillate O-demethylase
MDDQVDLTRTGPDTPTGRYLRLYWHPVCLATGVTDERGKSVVVLGERIVLFRDRSGAAQSLADRCAHRGSRLSLGWIEDGAIRCRYHGWKFSSDGRCVERPLERDSGTGACRVRSYPVREYLGLVFLYLGPDPAPEFPRWPEFDDSEASLYAIVRKGSYFLTLENNVDQLHVYYTHPAAGLRDPAWQRAAPPPGAALPGLQCEETDYGQSNRLEAADGSVLRTALFLMPTCLYFKSQANRAALGYDSFIWAVPIDDHHHIAFNVALAPRSKPEMIERLRDGRKCVDEFPPASSLVDAVLAGSRVFDDAGGRPDAVFIEDSIVIGAQDENSARDDEILGRSDRGVVLLRRIWRREVLAHQRGQPRKPFTPPRELGATLLAESSRRA